MLVVLDDCYDLAPVIDIVHPALEGEAEPSRLSILTAVSSDTDNSPGMCLPTLYEMLRHCDVLNRDSRARSCVEYVLYFVALKASTVHLNAFVALLTLRSDEIDNQENANPNKQQSLNSSISSMKSNTSKISRIGRAKAPKATA